MGYNLSTSHRLLGEVNDEENTPGPAVFGNTDPTATVSAGHRSRNGQKHSLEADTTTCRSTLVNHQHILNLTRIYLKKHANCMNNTFF